jgi:hypothetical protein
MDLVMVNLLRNIEEAAGNVFVDISSGENSLSHKLIADADITVVNLSQNIGITDVYFKCFKDKMPKGKVFYLFGNYDNRSKYNINNIRRLYHNDINIKNSAVIPYNTGYLDAQCDGKAVEFIRNNLKCRKDDENYYFIHKVMSATEKIFKLAGVNIDPIERT